MFDCRELQQTMDSMGKIEEEKDNLFKATEGLQTTLEVGESDET